MFARKVSMHLKPYSAAEFTRTNKKEIIPILRKQKGFQDEVTCVAPGGTDAFGISFWDKKASADAYGRDSYAEVVKALAKVTDGVLQVQSYEVANSTFHKIEV
jgi:hypothetical protein